MDATTEHMPHATLAPPLAAAARLMRRDRRRLTIRLRLTVLYGCLFMVSGVVLLTIIYLLVRDNAGHFVVLNVSPTPNPELTPARAAALRSMLDGAQAAGERENASVLHELLLQSAIALGVMSIVSFSLGWLMAGRVLAPLRKMTRSTRRISHENLHERLALTGPRDELTELSDTIDNLLARLEGAFESQRRFVANASHELRTPLTMMRTSLDVATGKPTARSPEMSILDRKLREGLDHADQLVESFLALARAQHAERTETSTVLLPEIAEESLSAHADAIDDLGLHVWRSLEPASVSGNRPLLQQMVGNLVDNAVRHNQRGGWIRIGTHHSHDRAQLVVESSGPPLHVPDVAELARPFRRAGAERTGSQNGFGLGLSIVDAIAEGHDGALHLEARDGGGLYVRVDLPLASQEPDRP